MNRVNWNQIKPRERAIFALMMAILCMMHAAPTILADRGESERHDMQLHDEDTVVVINKWTFRQRKRKKRAKSRERGHDSWGGTFGTGNSTSGATVPECEVRIQTRAGRQFCSTICTAGMNLADLIAHFASSVMDLQAFSELYDDGTMFVAFGENERIAMRNGGYLVSMTTREGFETEPLTELRNYDAADFVRVVVEWTNFDVELVEPLDQRSSDRFGWFHHLRNETPIITVLALLALFSASKITGVGLISGLAVPALVGSFEWTFRKKIQMETTANPSSQRAFERLGPIQSLAGDPIQNIEDAHDGGDEPSEVRLSIWDGKHSLPAAKASIYTNGLHEHIRAVKDGGEISREERLGALKGDMAHLNLECFHTVGLEGSEEDDEISWFGMAKKALDRLTKNRFFWFFRAQNATSEDQDRRGSWGEGKFTLESASLLGAHISLSIRKTASGLSRVLMGLTTLRWHAIYNPTKGYGTAKEDGKVTPDQFAPYGTFSRAKKNETGEGYAPMPIVDDDYLDQFSSDFRLERKDERGLSTVIMQPRHELRDPRVLAKAIIARWWVSIIEGMLVVKINHNGKSVFVIDSSSLRDVIASLDWDSEPEKIGSKNERNPAKLSIEQWDGLLDLHEWALNPPAEAVFETKVAGDQGASMKPTWNYLLSDEQKDGILKRGLGSEPCMVKLRTWVHQNGTKPQIGEIEYIFKTTSEELQAQVYTRRGMTIPFIAQTDRMLSIVRCDETALESMLRDSEGPAHLEWNRGAQRVSTSAEKWNYGTSTVALAVSGLKEIKTRCKTLSVEDHEWAEGFFIELEGGDETPVERRCKTCNRLVAQCICTCPVCGILKADCNGHKTPDFVGVPTNMPDGKVRLHRQGSFPGAGKKIKVRLAYQVGRGSAFSKWNSYDFDHNDIETDMTGATLKSISSAKGDKFTGGVELTLLIDEDDFEVLMWGWTPNRDVRVKIREVKI